MKKIIITTKSKSSRRGKKTKPPINITKIGNVNEVVILNELEETLLGDYVKNKPEIKKIIMANNATLQTPSKVKPKKNPAQQVKYLTHKVNYLNTNPDVFKIKNLKNNQNIKYFKNLPNSNDIFICSILSENFNIIKS
tara:strand:+ start:328 stop:741 length:414 start_codon:yes stop_codon:yes gene_type:complete